MTLQNRVDPWGQLTNTPARGAWLGNRGILHNDQQEIVAPWRHKSWVTCQLEFKGIKRKPFSPGNYSELFFLDEATALSAGHRPCAQCRRERFNEFKSLWQATLADDAVASGTTVTSIDKQLHKERAVRGGGKLTFQSPLGMVPDGAFIDHSGDALLLWQGQLHKWSAHGYSKAGVVVVPSTTVTVITPASITKVLALGFKPQVHESALSP
ncbi:hypothetical protein HNP48_006380 [Acidovorax soli]|uniref:Uncharacterized protein n=1 Tax=Acidovorax soli TaxID=592050 RepID=A0A7X0UCP3_9BURK|nr:hypothetical protein [Acidovorax soli]MBB6563656.1 hypothetical protein [Acidovorax soli]